MKKINIKKRISDNLDLPEEYTLGAIKLTVCDFERLNIINYKSIIEYGENLIRVNTKEKIIKIEGEGLGIISITDEEMGISGKIKGVNFE